MWRRNTSAKCPIYAGDPPNHKFIATVLNDSISAAEQEANLQFIVTACNAYTPMREALAQTTKILDSYLSDDTPPTTQEIADLLLQVHRVLALGDAQ